MTGWSTVDVGENWRTVDDEPLGSKDKFWVADPQGRVWLFKFCRERDGITRGEDWAEWLVYRLAREIGIPTAEIRPAEHLGRRGILSLSLVSASERLVHGNELLAGSNPSYDQDVNRGNPRYTVPAVATALGGIPAPLESPDLTDFDGFDVWAGYLMLDAWVAGRDRHHENWAVIDDGSRRRLAPSFDHGNALGFQETDPARLSVLATDDEALRRWAEKGRSPHFAGKPTLVAVADQALRLAHVWSTEHWLGKLQSVTEESMKAIIDEVPVAVMSEQSATFCNRLLTLNRRRVLGGH